MQHDDVDIKILKKLFQERVAAVIKAIKFFFYSCSSQDNYFTLIMYKIFQITHAQFTLKLSSFISIYPHQISISCLTYFPSPSAAPPASY